MKEKESVRLRSLITDPLQYHSSGGVNEELISLTALVPTIKERLINLKGIHSSSTLDAFETSDSTLIEQKLTSTSSQSTRDHFLTSGSNSSNQRMNRFTPNIECVYVDSDQYYVEKDAKASMKDTKKVKLPKIITKSKQRSLSFLNNLYDASTIQGVTQGTPIIATEVPFYILRDFGKSLH